MVPAMAVITILMVIMKTASPIPANGWRIIALALCIPALGLFHAALVSALLSLGFIDAADGISFNNPNISEAQGKKLRELALENSTSAEDRLKLLHTSLSHWQEGIESRPLWPYYQLGALDIEVLLAKYSKPENRVSYQQKAQARISHIIELAPNERGLDHSLLILSFIAWDWLEQENKSWLIERLKIVKRSTLKEVFFYAKQANNQQDICAHLSWNAVKKLCSAP